jgi:DNA-binding SARP family transcriptional activator/tetratricopeptide (TPR) repeat protein
MEYGILGPVQARVSGRTVPVGGPREQKALASLLLDLGRAVSAARLIDVLWGANPPPTCAAQLRNTMTALRRRLGGEADSAPIVRAGDGYLIDVSPDRLDATRFERGVTEAQRLAEFGRLPDAADVLRGALALWRGPALAGLDGDALAVEAYRWEEKRLACLEQRIEFDLALGRHRDVVGELGVLVADHPLRERLLELHLLAMYRSGRRQDALAAYAAARTRLAEHAGLDPGPELVALQQAILRDDPTLLDRGYGQPPLPVPPAPRPGVAVAPAAGAPAQLPLGVRGFSGRTSEIEQLDAVRRTCGQQPAAVVISALWGTAGVGKTALAVHWAHTVAHHFPDGQLYVNLRGFDPSGVVMDPSEAMRGFLDALGVPASRVPADPQTQAALYRTRLAGRRVLILLDNARNAEQVRPLLPGSATCLVVVTSRNQLPGLIAAEGAHPVSLDLLTAHEARELLAHRLGGARIAAEPDAVDEIIARAARLPLALAIVAARAATSPALRLEELAADLRATETGLDAFASTDTATDARSVFSWSYRALSTPAAALFRLLGLHPGPIISTTAVASLAGMPAARIQPLLAELAGAHLIAEHAPHRYVLHDLLRAYADELNRRHDSNEDRTAARHRILDHYLHNARRACEPITHAMRFPLDLPPPRAGVTTLDFADLERAIAWLTAEHQVLLAVVKQAASTGFDTHSWQLAATLTAYFNLRGHWHDWVETGAVGLAATRRSGERRAEAYAHRFLAHATMQLGRDREAEAHLGQALTLFVELSDLVGQARTHRGLAKCAERAGRPEAALDHAHRCLALYLEAGHRTDAADAYNEVGWYQAQLGQYEQTLANCQRALGLQRETGDHRNAAATWDSLGYAHHHLGDHEQAIACYREALRLVRDTRYRYGEAEILTNLGDTHRAVGDDEAAGEAWTAALLILDELEHPGAEEIRVRLRDLTTCPTRA